MPTHIVPKTASAGRLDETTGHHTGLTEGIRTPDIRDHNAAL